MAKKGLSVKKMKIERIFIDGFRNINNVDINLGKITSLVSLNNYGKSNVLAGIKMGLNFIKKDKERKKSYMQYEDNIPIHNLLSKKNFKFEIEGSLIFNEKKCSVIYSYEFEWIKNNIDRPEAETEGCKIINESLQYKEIKPYSRYKELIKRNGNDIYYRKSIDGRCDKEIDVAKDDLVVNKILIDDNLFYRDIVEELNNINFYFEDRVNIKDSFNFFDLQFTDPEMQELAPENIARILYELEKNDRNKYELLINAYKILFPDIKKIKTIKIDRKKILEEFDFDNNDNDVPYIKINDIYSLLVLFDYLNQPISFDQMSDGAKRILLTLTKIVISSITSTSLIAIEEPENSIHPDLFNAYIQILNDLLENCNMIITSHSPYAIKYLNVSNIYVGLSEDPGVAEFKKIKKANKIINDASEFDMNVGEYIFDLLENDVDELRNYLEV